MRNLLSPLNVLSLVMRDPLGAVRLEPHADGNIVNPGLMPQNQPLKCRAAPALGLFDQLGVRPIAPGAA